MPGHPPRGQVPPGQADARRPWKARAVPPPSVYGVFIVRPEAENRPLAVLNPRRNYHFGMKKRYCSSNSTKNFEKTIEIAERTEYNTKYLQK
jgi:hypothetical protein